MEQTQISPTATIEVITPEIAGTLLASNEQNRPMKPDLLARYTRSMNDGRWIFNGDTIRLTVSGRLIDGQHRLSAVIASGKPIQAVVVRNLQDAAFLTVDQGKGRSYADLLRVNSITADAAAALWKEEQTAIPGARKNIKPEASQLSAWVLEHPDLEQTIQAIPNQISRVVHIRHFAAFFYRAYKAEPEKATQFMNELTTGEGLKAGSAVYALRERLMKENKGHTKLKPSVVKAFIWKAWNAYLSETPIYKLGMRKAA